MGIQGMKYHYLEYRTQRYLLEHPKALAGKARKYARVAWSRKVARWQKRGLVADNESVVGEQKEK